MNKTKWEVKREASYQAIVASAMRCFHERGYSATRIEDIVRGTEYSPGAFYFHFKNKQECFWGVAAHRERLRFGWHEAALAEQSNDLATILRAALRRLSASPEGHEGWTRVMAGYFESHRDDPVAIARLRSAYERWMAELAVFVAALQRRGLVDKHRDSQRLATKIYAFAEGLTMHALIFELDPDARDEALVDGIVQLLRDGPRSKAPESTGSTTEQGR